MKRKLESIINIPFLACLAILLLNDFYLKIEYHNWLTGKLSDFCGLFVFASFWTVLLPNKKQMVYFSTALVFTIWKSPYSQPFIDFFSESIYPIHRVVDITDIMALTILPIAFYYNPGPNIRIKISPIPFALLSVFSFCATSVPQPTQVFEQPQYVLFKSGITAFEDSDYPSEYKVHNLDTLVVIDIKRIRIDERASIDDEFHKVQILKDIELRLLRELTDGYRTQRKLIEYEDLRDSLTESRATLITLKLDTIIDELNFKKTRLDGNFKRYTTDNRLTIEGKYKNGVEDSIWTFYNRQNEILSRKYFENGELIKTEIFEKTKRLSQLKFNTRAETVRNKYFHLAIILVLIISLLIKLYLNFRRSEAEDIIRVSNFSGIAGSLTLPLGILMVAKVFSSVIPNSYSTFFLGIFGEAILVYVVTTPIFFIIFYLLKLRNRLDLIYHILLLSFAIVFTEEWIYLKSIL